MPTFNLFVTIVALSLLLSISARNLSEKELLSGKVKLNEDEASSCWDSLLELHSCSSEIVLFFLNGETYLGPSCCSAIRYIQHQCWPSMFGSLGISAEESDILRGYCDASSDDGSDSGSPPPSTPNNTTTRAL